jgi:hypothetical protein
MPVSRASLGRSPVVAGREYDTQSEPGELDHRGPGLSSKRHVAGDVGGSLLSVGPEEPLLRPIEREAEPMEAVKTATLGSA